MQPKGVIPGESFPAFVAFVRFDAGMKFDMLLQVVKSARKRKQSDLLS